MLSKKQRFQLEQAILGQVLNFECYEEVHHYIKDWHFHVWPGADFRRIWHAIEEVHPQPISVVTVASSIRRAANPQAMGLTKVIADCCASVSSSANLDHDLLTILQDSLSAEVRENLFFLIGFDELPFNIYCSGTEMATELTIRGASVIQVLMARMEMWTEEKAPDWAINQLATIIGKAIAVEEKCIKLSASSMLKRLRNWESVGSADYLQDSTVNALHNYLNRAKTW